MDDKVKLEQRKQEIETAMAQPDFWSDKVAAQAMVKELQEVKDAIEGVGKYDKGDAVMTIFAGAGGDDAEDFARMLYEMYTKYCGNRGWLVSLLHENHNTMGGYRNITVEISGKSVYGTLKGENGVHRLVRVSPFNAKGARHTSFAMVEVLPKFEKATEITIPTDDLRVEFSKSSGPGGQNVNKRETAVRVVHIPTGISVHVSNERSQETNRDRALEMVKAKLYVRAEEERKARAEGMMISKTTDIEWGNQRRNYVLHPYKLVKDTITGVETTDVEGVFDGDIQEFLDAHR